jgi:hypothetical protein
VAPSLATTQWLLTCFVCSALPLRALLRVWDAFFAERHVAFLLRTSVALLVTSRDALLSATDTGDAYQLLTSLGHNLTSDDAIDGLLRAAASLRERAMLLPRQHVRLRERHALRIEAERGVDAANVVRAAVATANATEAEVRQEVELLRRCNGGRGGVQSKPSFSGAGALADMDSTPSEWTVVPVPVPCSPPAKGASARGCGSGTHADQREAEPALEEWSLIEPRPAAAAGACASRLSYVILQLEAPRLLEAYFGGDAAAATSDPSMDPRVRGMVEEAAARLDALGAT